MDGVMRSSQSKQAKHSSAINRSAAQKSTTLNRKFVKRPNLSAKSTSQQVAKSSMIAKQQSKIQRSSVSQKQLLSKKNSVKLQPAQTQQAIKVNRVAATAQNVLDKRASAQKSNAQMVQKIVNQRQIQSQNPQLEARMNQSLAARNARARMAAKNGQKVHMTAQEMKNRAVNQALNKMNQIEKSSDDKMAVGVIHFWQKRSFAVVCALLVLFVSLMGYLVYLNLPDLSVRVAAMQSGIENAYPSYVPMGYRLDGLVKEDNGTITMGFTNNDGGKWTLIEQKSSWDSMAVKSKYVETNWGNDYTIARGQGLTIYISGSNAIWVNGGVLYRIEDSNSGLSADDLHDIAVSL